MAARPIVGTIVAVLVLACARLSRPSMHMDVALAPCSAEVLGDFSCRVGVGLLRGGAGGGSSRARSGKRRRRQRDYSRKGRRDRRQRDNRERDHEEQDRRLAILVESSFF